MKNTRAYGVYRPFGRYIVPCIFVFVALLGNFHLSSAYADVQEFWRAVDIAQSQNPQIHKAEAALRISREDDAQALAKLLPTADLTASYAITGTHYKRLGTKQHSEPRKIELTIEQTLFNMTEFLDYSQSDLVREAAYAALMASRQDVVLQVSTVAANWLEAKQVLALADEYRKVTKRHVKVVKLRLDAGESTETEYNESSSRAAQAEASYEDALNTMNKEAAFFNEIVGRYPDKNLSLPDLTWSEPGNLDEQIWRWIEDRPDVWAARAKLQEREYDVKIERSKHLPYADLEYTASRTWGSELGGSSGISSRDREDAHQLLFTVTLPLVQGGEVLSKTRAAKANKESALAELDRVKNLAHRQVEEARHDLKNNQIAIVALEKALAFSNKALAGLEEEYLAGTRILTDLLDSRYEVFTLNSTLVRHKYQAQLALVRLWHSLGRSVVPKSMDPIGDHEEITHLAHAGREAVIDQVVEKERAIFVDKVAQVRKEQNEQPDEGLDLLFSALMVDRGPRLSDPPTYMDQRRSLAELTDSFWLEEDSVESIDSMLMAALIPETELPKTMPAVAENGEYMIHLGTYAKEDNIAPMLQSLAKLGIPSWIELIKTPEDNRTMSRVVAGPFTRYAAMQEALDDIQRRIGVDAGWVPYYRWNRYAFHLHNYKKDELHNFAGEKN